MTAVLKLYEISDAMQAIAEALIENGGDTITPELAGQLDAIEGEFEQKVERCVLYIRNLEATAEAAKQEAQRLTVLATSRTNAADSLKRYVKGEMERTEHLKVETPLIVARVQKNSAPSVAYTGSLDTLPTEYVRITRSLDSRAVIAALKAGAALPEGVAVETGTHLRIR